MTLLSVWSTFADDDGMRWWPMMWFRKQAIHGIMDDMKPWFGFGKCDMQNSDNSTGSKLHQALISGDYPTFQLLSSKNFAKNGNKRSNLTKEQFEKMSVQAKKHDALCKAIKNNDYNAFVTALTPSQTDFAQIVKYYQMQQTIRQAFQDKNYDAFVKAVAGTKMEKITKEQFEKMASHRLENPKMVHRNYKKWPNHKSKNYSFAKK